MVREVSSSPQLEGQGGRRRAPACLQRATSNEEGNGVGRLD